MKIIFSRKGFDSGTGRKPSPILPDGKMVSLPIPDRRSPIAYRDLILAGENIGQIVEVLTERKIQAQWKAHIDPDLIGCMYPRQTGWRPLFGQTGAAQTHLNANSVSPGDVFLFFGWFRKVELTESGYRYKKHAPDLHVLFGWLQIGEILSVYNPGVALPGWTTYHPHLFFPDRGSKNTLYIASEWLNLPGLEASIPGGGGFSRFQPGLCLTQPEQSRSIWQLPAWIFPEACKIPLTYHSDPARWVRGKDYVTLKSAARGQEFILDSHNYPEAIEWVRDLIFTHSENTT